MSLKISNSAVNIYSTCSKKYYLHYVSRLRAKTVSSALIFGSTLDKALNQLVQDKNLDAAKNLFLAAFTNSEINKKIGRAHV